MPKTILTPEDTAALEAMCEGSAGYFYRMLDYLEERVREGVRRGDFTEEEARADLDTALWYSYACNNIDEYEYYYRAARWMPASERAAEAAGCGMWYYRYACALLYCGRPEEALEYARKGVEAEPDYVWGWLQLAKLLGHFGDRAGALAAAERGLSLVPGDYEFTTVLRELREGRTLEEMEYHWIDPEQDRRLQAGETDGQAEAKRRAIAGILCDRENLEAIRAVLRPSLWEPDGPYCTFSTPWGEDRVVGRYLLRQPVEGNVRLRPGEAGPLRQSLRLSFEFGRRASTLEAEISLDRGARALRQPGSALKPFVYGLAFENGLLTPASLLSDEDTFFEGGFRPRNYDESYHGFVSARAALGRSARCARRTRVRFRANSGFAAPAHAFCGCASTPHPRARRLIRRGWERRQAVSAVFLKTTRQNR